MKKITFVLTSMEELNFKQNVRKFFKFNDYRLEKMYLVRIHLIRGVYSEIKKWRYS